MIITVSMLKEKCRDYKNPLDKIKRDAADFVSDTSSLTLWKKELFVASMDGLKAE